METTVIINIFNIFLVGLVVENHGMNLDVLYNNILDH